MPLFLFAGINAYSQFIDQGNILTQTAAETCRYYGQQQSRQIKRNDDRSGQYSSAVLQVKGDIGDDKRVGKIGKIGMPAQNMEQIVQLLWVALHGKDGKEEQARSNGVEYAPGAKLMRCVNGFQSRIAIKVNFFVVIGHESA